MTWWPASAPGWRVAAWSRAARTSAWSPWAPARHADLAFWVGILDADFEVVDSPELAEAVERLARGYTRAAG